MGTTHERLTYGRRKNGIILENAPAATIELYELLLKITTAENRNTIVNKAMPIAIAAYRELVPVSKKNSARNYVGSGNLRRSVKDLRKVIPKWDWKNGTVGTHKTGRAGKGKKEYLYTDDNYDGYYAHMIYGGAKAWYRRVVAKAANKSRALVIATMAQEAKRVIAAQPKRFWQN